MRDIVAVVAILVAALAGAIAPGCSSSDDRNALRGGGPPTTTTDPAASTGPALVVTAEGASAPGEMSLAEGSVGHVLVALSAPPTAPVTVNVAFSQDKVVDVVPRTLTFDASNFNVAQTLTVSALADDNAVSEQIDLTLSAAGLADAKLALKIADADTQVLTVTPSILTVTEGATDAFTVRPAYAPAGDMVVTIASNKPTAATVSPSTLTFTAANYATPQKVTVTGVVDANVSDESVDLTLKAAGLADTAVSVTVTDKDVLNISVAPSSLALVEGGAAQAFAVSLTQQPAADLTVTLTSSDPTAAKVTPATLTFTAASYATPQMVTVTPVDDLDTANEAVTISASATGLTTKDVTVSVKDDDVQAIVTSANAVTVNEGGTATFTARLAFDPVTPVTIDLRTSNPAAATLSPATLTFTSADYMTPKTVTVSGVIDANTVAETVSLTLTSAGLPTKTVTATTVDKDTQAIVASPTAVSVTEVGTATVSVRLAFNPLADTAVAVASSDTSAVTVSPATLTFTAANYATPQTVVLTGVKSAGTVNRTANATLTAGGITPVTVPVTIVDVDVQSLSIAPTSLTLTENGATGSFAVKLTQAPAANVVVNVASQNTAVATVSPATLTFTPANYGTAQSVTVTPVKDANTVTDTTVVAVSAAGVTTQNVAVTVNDVDTQSLVVTPSTLSVTEGMTSTFSVRLAAAPVSPIAVTVTSSNGLAASASPTSLTFSATDYATPKSVTVTGVVDANMTSETVTMTVAATGIANATVTVTTVDTTKPSCDMAAPLPNPASGNHNAGLSCIQAGCHDVKRGQLSGPFIVAGTLYGSVAGGAAVPQATMHVIDANGVDHKIVTATNGNFWSTDATIAFPVTVRASLCPNTDQKMASAVNQSGGSCNSCHNSGFRIHLP